MIDEARIQRLKDHAAKELNAGEKRTRLRA